MMITPSHPRSRLLSATLATTLAATTAGCAVDPEGGAPAEDQVAEVGEAIAGDADGAAISRAPAPLVREWTHEERPEAGGEGRAAAPRPRESHLERAAREAPDEVVRVLVEPAVPRFPFHHLAGADEPTRRAGVTERRAQIAPAQDATAKRITAAGGKVLGASWLSAQITAEMTARAALELSADPSIARVSPDAVIQELAIPGNATPYDGLDIRNNTRGDDLIDAGHDALHGGRAGDRVRIGFIEANTTGSNFPCKDHVGFKNGYGGATRLIRLYECTGGACAISTRENNTGSHASAVLWAAGGDLTDGQDGDIADPTERVRHSGVAPESALYLYSAHTCSDLVAALGQAITDGVDILNMSAGLWDGACDTNHHCADAALESATDAGVLFVAGAGNKDAGGACMMAYPALRTETIAVAALASDRGTPYGSTLLDTDSSSRGGVPIVTRSGSTSTTAGIDISAPGWFKGAFSGEPNLYSTRGWEGTSMAAPIVAGFAALLKEAFYEMGWASTANNARRLAVNLLLSGDGWDHDTNMKPIDGVSPSSGFGRIRAHWPSSNSLVAPWAWGSRSFTIQQGQTVKWTVGTAEAESPLVTEWKWAFLWTEDDLDSTSDIIISVYDTCPAGGGAPVLVARDMSYGMRKHIRLLSSSIGGKCLEMQAKAYAAPPGGTVVYSADYFHGGDVASH